MLPRSLKNARISALAAALFLMLSVAFDCAAQSSDPGYPAPVFSNEVAARIAPRDVGDARRTRHFYTFRGTEGDLLVTLESSDLVGAVDVFTATTQRPQLNITLIGEATRISKSFYIRKEETLILRVEARAVGDAEGSYRITFGGSFAPAPTELANAPSAPAPTVSSPESRGKNTRRVTSTGARIEEPVAATPVKEEESKTTPAETTATEKPTARKEPPAPRRGRGTRAGSGRTRASTAKPAATNDPTKPEPSESKTSDTSTQPGDEKRSDENKTISESANAETPAPTSAKKPAPRKRGARTSPRNARVESSANSESTPAQPAATPTPAAPKQRLVIVTKDGETLERDMNTVRRVTVENNQLVVVSKDGKVTRQPMANVLRMSIEP